MILIGIVALVSGMTLACLNKMGTNMSDESANINTGNYIAKAIMAYLLETEDYELKFDNEDDTLTVEKIITNLQERRGVWDGYFYLRPGEDYIPKKHYFLLAVRGFRGFFNVFNLLGLSIRKFLYIVRYML